MKKCFFIFLILTFSIYGCAGMIPEYRLNSIQHKYAANVALLKKDVESNPDVDLEKNLKLCEAYAGLKKYNNLFSCLDLFQKRGDLDSYFANPSIIRAKAYVELGQYDKAVEHGEQAASYSLEHRSRNVFNPIDALSVLGVAYALGGKKEEAEKTVRQLELLKNYDFIISIRDNRNSGLARIYMALGQYQNALHFSYKLSSPDDLMKNMLDSATGLDFWFWHHVPLMFIQSKSLFEIGRLEEAKVVFEKLLAIERIQEHGSIYWQLLADLGRIYMSDGQSEKGIELLSKAIEAIEQQRSSINTEASKIGFVGDKQAIYYHLVTALFDNGRFNKAFEYAERGKARALVDMLATKKQFSGENVNADKVAALLQELNEAEMRSIAVAYQDASSEEIVNVRSVVVKKKEQIAQVSHQLASLVSVSTANIKTIQSLLPSDETLVEYFGMEDTLFAFIVSNNEVRGVKLKISGLNEDIETFRKYIMLSPKEIRGLTKVKVSDSSIPVSRANQLRMSGETLYEKLIQPLESMIHTKNLTIVPHGALHYLPFNALNSGEKYLIDRYNIRVLPSASVMTFLKDRREGHAGNLLAFGNPDLGDPAYDLPGAQNEAIAITKDQPKSKLLLRKQATETAVKSFGAQFRYIHFATHGTFDAEKPLSSGLLLAGDSENDGTLTVGELYDLHLPADLVTLSACETALGKVANGDDVVGFTRGFLYAGVSSIVSSLWKVDDQATSILMQEFYKSLKETDKRSALRTAQLKVKDTYNSHPYFWAAFQITGSVQ